MPMENAYIYNAGRLRDFDRFLKSDVATLDGCAEKLMALSDEISALKDTEAVKRDGYHRMLRSAAEYVAERATEIELIGDHMESLADIVESYENQVVGIWKNGPWSQKSSE